MTGATPADVLVLHAGIEPIKWADGITDLGLTAGDEIDALCVKEDGSGVYDSEDQVLFSLAPGSPSLAARSASAADLWIPGHPAVPFYQAALLGLQSSDDVTALMCSFELQPAELRIAKSVTPGSAMPGQVITYTVAFSNAGGAMATGIVITDIVPVTLTDVSYISAGEVITPVGGVSFAWQVADLAIGEGGVITLTGYVTSNLTHPTVFTNTAIITGAVTDPDLTNNIASVPLTVTPMFTLTVTKSGTGSGLVTSTPGSINCGSACQDTFAYGTLVTLSATPSITSTFAGWGGACVGTGTCEVTMTEAKTVTATFDPYRIYLPIVFK
jgi:uncharacterized repeat protein (TIGR01451 family)